MFKSIFAVALVLVATFAGLTAFAISPAFRACVKTPSLAMVWWLAWMARVTRPQTPFTTQSLNNMLSQLGITVPAGTNMQLKNVAAVMVTASLPGVCASGQTIDVVVPPWVTPKPARVRC